MHILKIGGDALDDTAFLSVLPRTLAVLDGPVVIVHGGGRAIAYMQERLGLEKVKVDGIRVTDSMSLDVAQMVLSGQANKRIVAALIASGVDALGLSGVDRGLFRCTKKHHPAVDLGLVGDLVQVRIEVIAQLIAQQVTPVISPISLGLDGQAYNVNADEAAGALALALSAQVLDFVSNVPGVLQGGVVITSLNRSQAEDLIASGVIIDGMIPKVHTALAAVEQGIPKVRIVDLAGLSGDGGTAFIL